MARRPSIVKNRDLHICLPPDLMGKLDLFLWSDLEQRVPQGAYQRFFSERIVEFFDTLPPRKDYL